MNHNKSLLLVVAEWWESRKAHQLSIGGKSSGFWRWFLPTPGNVIFTLLVIGSLLWAQSVGAVSLGAPTVNSSLTIPYQGRLANASGTPFTGNQNMEFRLYNAPSGGTPLWSELWTGGNSVTVNDGLFSVLLGSLQSGLPGVVQGNSQLWLGITVGTDGEMSPRVQLGSAAYSMQALTVPDGSVTGAKIQDGNITSAKIKAESDKTCVGAVPNNYLTFAHPGGGSHIAVPDLIRTFNLAKPSKVLLWMDGIASLNDSTQGVQYGFVLRVDGGEVTNSIDFSSPWHKLTGLRVVELGAGSHSLSVSVYSTNAGTITVHGGYPSGYATCIGYSVLGIQ